MSDQEKEIQLEMLRLLRRLNDIFCPEQPKEGKGRKKDYSKEKVLFVRDFNANRRKTLERQKKKS